MIFQCMTNSFKKELFEGVHDFTSDTFKIALYDATAELGPATTAYSAVGEISGTNYTTGGGTLTAVAPTTLGTTALVDFADYEFSSVTVSGVVGGLIYNSSKSNRAVCVLSFGLPQSRTAESFWVRFPEATAESAVLRIQ